jgi:type I restriction enzyme S subunit
MTVSWPKVRINEAGHVQAGRQRSPSIVAGLMRPYLRVANVHDGYIDYHDVLEMPFSDSEFEVFSLRQGDILLNEGQSLKLVGRSAVYEGPARKYCFQNSLIRFRASDKIDITFAHLMFQHLLSSGVFASIATRTTSIAHLGVERFAAILIPLPDMGEQRAISRVFSAWDSAIGQLSDLIAAKVRFKQGLTHKLLTGEERFPSFTDNWNQLRLAEVASECSERARNHEASPVLSCTKHDGLVLSLSYFGRRVFSEDTSGYKVVRRNQFAYATNHIEEGSIGLLKDCEKGLVSPMYTVFCTNSSVNPQYLIRLLKTETYKKVFKSLTRASVDRRGSLRWKQFSNILIRLPCISEQLQIEKCLAALDSEIRVLQKELAAVRLQKKALMQKLLTGQIRLKWPSCSGLSE